MTIFNSKRGFTLIELMIVLSITAVLGTIGVAGFMTYNKAQILQSSASNLATMLNLAKSRAQSQVKLGASCSESQTLEGYSVDISFVDNKYTLNSRCLGVLSAVDTKSLPQNVSFKSPDTSPASFFFPVQKGGVEASGQIVILDSGGRTKTIIINSLGGVSVQ